MQRITGRLPKLLGALLLSVHGLAAGIGHFHCCGAHQATHHADYNPLAHGHHCSHPDHSSSDDTCPRGPAPTPDHNDETCPACRLLAEHVLPFSVASPVVGEEFVEAVLHFGNSPDDTERRYSYLSRAPPIV